MARTFYRVVTTNPPTLIDFTSNAGKGKVLRRPDPEALLLWEGVSVSATEDQARLQARMTPWIGRYIAVLQIPEGGSIRWERTTRTRGHHTLWGEPADLLACVVSVMPLG
jgi:hypothetical protein